MVMNILLINIILFDVVLCRETRTKNLQTYGTDSVSVIVIEGEPKVCVQMCLFLTFYVRFSKQ